MEYGTVHVISLDDQPLATSRKILIQAFSEEKMYGFRAENGIGSLSLQRDAMYTIVTRRAFR